mgnify:CR=1 FL=1
MKTLFGDSICIPSVVDQRDYQRRGGVCARHPYSCFFCDVLEVLGIEKPIIVDLTYGVGSFYIACRDRVGKLIAVDIRKWEWLVQPDVFIQKSFWFAVNEVRDKADIVVFDPPYATNISSRGIEYGREWLYFGAEVLPTMIEKLPEAADRVLRPGGYVLVKFMDAHRDGYIDPRLSHIAVVNTMVQHGYGLKDILIYRMLHRHRPKTNNRVLKTHSYLLIFQR